MELNSTPEVKIILDSMAEETGQRIVSFQLRYQRFIHAEFMTHRIFSRNASSSRAIPVEKMLQQVSTEPAAPTHWGKNQKGMQANEHLDAEETQEAQRLWGAAAVCATKIAEQMNELGLHKQVANRILEPFQFISVIATATNFDNFFDLRCHKDAQPEFRVLAEEMNRQYVLNEPQVLFPGEYHLPYILAEEWGQYTIEELVKFSVARCARVSYLTHDKQAPKAEDDLALYERLVGSVPLHASPTEHQAKIPSYKTTTLNGNFSDGFIQFRKCLEKNKTDLFWTNEEN